MVEMPAQREGCSGGEEEIEALPQVDGAEAETKAAKLTKNQKKKEKKKKSEQAKKQALGDKMNGDHQESGKGGASVASWPPEAPLNVDIEYVADAMIEKSDPHYDEWLKIFEHFQKPKEEPKSETEKDKGTEKRSEKEKEKEKEVAQKPKGDDSDDEGVGKKEKLSRKKFKALHRLSIAELKQLVKRPDVVEVWDVTASDPRLLVFLKSYRNSVAVPRHWCNKRKYLQGKRGIEKAAFQLPSFIEATGIAKLRQSYEDKESELSAKQKARNQSRPKMSKMDIDYQVLHDAFFKFQTKPFLSKHGDLYFEGKEFEVKVKEQRPGSLSDGLKAALGMPSEGIPVPPPWLINMQRYGPPPSYPNLKIPGLNAPIPSGAAFGYHPGGWGKPPVDEFGRPIYGDVFGVTVDIKDHVDEETVEKKRWGEIEAAEEESEEEEEEEEPGEEDLQDGITSVVSGLETPATASGMESMDLRKGSMGGGTETPDSSLAGPEFLRKDQSLYKVIQQEDVKVNQGDVMGSSFRYNIVDPVAAAQMAAAKKDKNLVNIIKNQATAGVDVTIDASELEGMDESMLAEKYQETIAQQKAQKEDLSGVFEEQAKKRKKQQAGKDAKSKKYKEYQWT